jgi:general secretion pathway protein E
MGLYEMLIIDDAIRGMVHEGAGEDGIAAHARNRHQSLRADGISKVLAGLTTLEEVLRVTQED